jgi:ABC-type transport system involved in Fe-S cluster assembly fused permease/ATPase subunit
MLILCYCYYYYGCCVFAVSTGECVATVIIFYVKFSDWRLATMAFCALAVYGFLTVKITLWRKKFRTATNKHDNDFHDKATDSIINYETVKYFTAESYEVERFTK